MAENTENAPQDQPSPATRAAADPDNQTASVEGMAEVPGGPQVAVPGAQGEPSPDEAKDPHLGARGRD
ncbi:hypothetical protein ACFQ34_14615 [Pseudonocardia benzenivorans]|uniref:Uncharacterized protein n=2 Tax=Pseudonocardia TaxID=1847 RepID=F4CSU7_PSEUX|nr:hypothetical protein [Pseudonocardia dioxanivorans]AEA24550.1 hypothetical protein Psed_2340 [Pseudonocardia dioxanivorans CB1190]